MRYEVLLSVVVPVFNSGIYIDELMHSIILQKTEGIKNRLRFKIKYKKFYEVILVDDGSTDESAEICDYYAERYDFVSVIHTEHSGVSVARNLGLSTAKGKYVTFPDSDDVLSDEVFASCIEYFEKHKGLSLVTYPLSFFDGQSGEHWTEYRFRNGSRVINIMNEWDSPQFFTASSFFLLKDIENLRFDETLTLGEDLKFVNELLMKKNTLLIGLVSECRYFYRRRTDGKKSIIQNSKNTSDYYAKYNEVLLMGLIKKSIEQYGYVPYFLQYTIMSQLQWRLNSIVRDEISEAILGKDEYVRFICSLENVLGFVDMEVIEKQKCLTDSGFKCAIKMKNNKEMQKMRFENCYGYTSKI